MHVHDPRITQVIVDGAKLLLPNEAAFSALEGGELLDGRRIATGAILEHHRALSRRIVGLEVALGEERVPGKPFVVVHLVTLRGLRTRVVVESSNCLACGTSMLVGVTRNYDIYMGTHDPLAAVRVHADDPVVPCTACGGALDRPAVVVLEERQPPS